ncbi:MAG: hypothetical protein SFX18_02135 [Pirellulales bacterium]|nr:hypothetical protein [Pirellulales bacterium]
MEQFIELHDTTLVSVTNTGHETQVELLAMLHRSPNDPEKHTVWLQLVILSLSVSKFTPPPADLPLWIADGFLRLNDVVHENVIPDIREFQGDIELAVVLVSSESWTVRADALQIKYVGEPKFLEKFPACPISSMDHNVVTVNIRHVTHCQSCLKQSVQVKYNYELS